MLSLRRVRSQAEQIGGTCSATEDVDGGTSCRGELMGEVEVPWNVVDIIGGGPLLCVCSAPGSKTAGADLSGTVGDAEGSAR